MRVLALFCYDIFIFLWRTFWIIKCRLDIFIHILHDMLSKNNIADNF